MDDNNTKLWAARITWWVLSTVDLTILGKLIGGFFGKKSDHPLPWIILLVIVTAASVYSLMLYYRYKAVKKSGSEHKTPEQLEVETLAAYGAMQQQQAAQAAQQQGQNQNQGQGQPKPPQNLV